MELEKEHIMAEKVLYQIIINLNITCQLLLSALIFYLPLQRKRYFALWLLLSLVCDAGLLGIAVLIRVQWNVLATRFIMRALQFSVPLVIVLLCYDDSIYVKLKTWCASVAAMEAAAALFAFILALCRVDERVTISFRNTTDLKWFDWGIYYLIHLIIYIGIYLICGRKKPEELDRSGKSSTLLLAFGCLLFLTIPDCISNEYRFASYPLFLVNRVYLLALAAFILAICTSIEFQSRYRTDMEILDQVLVEERKQYQQMKENMDMINVRCHDLKHQLDDFSGKLTDREIESLQDAMDFYDSNIKTGSEVLDVVLHMHQLVCRPEGIELTCLADGACLSFVRTRHLYSLLNNAIGNAIEAVRKLEEAGMKTISVTVARERENAVIEVTNFFDGKPIRPGGTSKADHSRHGFGTMSMRYIAESYGGSICSTIDGRLYSLRITLPIPEKL